MRAEEETLESSEEEVCVVIMESIERGCVGESVTAEVDSDMEDAEHERVICNVLVLKLVLAKVVVKSILLDWLDVDPVLGTEETLDKIEERLTELLDDIE
jgi:hypothetical protein